MPKTIYFAFLLSLIIGVSSAFAQTASKMNYPLIRSIDKSPNAKQTAYIKADPTLLKKYAPQFNVKVAYSTKNISVIEGTGADLKALASKSFVLRMESTKHHLQVMDDSSLSKNNVNLVHSGAAPLATGYTGKDVIIGVIDTGIDFNHPDFKDSTGKTRLLWLWDQDNTDTFNIPQPYNYGRDWNNSEIDSGWCTSLDPIPSHGTKVSGVAAGNGMTAFEYRGIAPDADIIFVSLDFNSSGPVMTDAINYIFDKADAAGKPCVINISIGDYYGSHDGTDLQAQMIDQMITAQPARAIIAANGNSGNNPIHLGYNVTSDTSFTWVSNATNEIIFDVYADSSAFTNVRWTIGASNNSNFTYEGNIGFRASDSILNAVTEDTLRYLGNQIGIVYTYTEIVDSLVILSVYVAPDSLNYLWSFETTGSGKLDSWSPDYKHSNLPSASLRPDMIYYKLTDTLQTVCTSFQCSNEVISVGNYVGRTTYLDVTNTPYVASGVVDSIFTTSSLGPTRDGRIKPDISATGENIVTVGGRDFLTWLIANFPFAVTEDSMHMTFGGTSAASPVTAGMAALYFEMYPTATNQQLKQDMINCSKHDLFTGPTANNRYGYGKLDAYGALTCQNPIGIKNNTALSSDDLLVYPNPADQFINLTFKNENSTAVIELLNVLGQTVYQAKIKTSSHTINTSSLPSGIYIVKIIFDSKKLTRKIIIE